MTTPIYLTVTNALAYAKTSSNPIAVVDSVNMIASNQDALTALGSQLVSVKNVSASTFDWSISVANVIALASKMTDAYGNPEIFSGVVDTAANVAGNKANLSALSAQVSAIFINDTAVNVATFIDDLQSNASQILNIRLTDYYTPTLSVTLDQFFNDATVLGKISGFYNLFVYRVNTASLANVFSNAHVFGVTLLDTASNINNNLDYLQTYIYKISNIYLTNSDTPILSVSFDQYSRDVTALAKIYSIYKLSVSGVIVSNLAYVFSNNHVSSVTLVDMYSNINSSLDYLQAYVDKISAINLTSNYNSTPALYIYASQLIQDALVLSKITNSYDLWVSGVTTANMAKVLFNPHVTRVILSDTALNIDNSLDYLQTNITNKIISTIYLIDGGTPTLSVSSSQLINDSVVLGSILSSYNLSVSDVTISDLASVLTNPHVISVSIADMSGNIINKLDYLQANIISKINSVILKDSFPPILPVSASQFINDATVLGKITSSYSLYVYNLTLANLAYVLSNTHVSMVTLSDSANNVANNIDYLQANTSKIATITLNDNGTPNLFVFANQFFNDAAVLGKILGSYFLSVYWVTTANLASVLSNTHVSMVTLSDSANNVANNIDYLQTNTYKILTITLNDNGTPTLFVSFDQLTHDYSVLVKISGSYFLSVYGVTTANLASVFSNFHVSMVSLVDTANNVTNNIDYLQANTSKIATITLNDNGTPTLFVFVSQFINDAAVLGKISGSYFLSVYGVTTANLTNVLSNVHVSIVSLVDSANNVANIIDYLQANTSKIATITLNDNGTPTLSVSASQLSNDAAVLGKISGSYFLSVYGVTTANLANVLSNSHVISVKVYDTASLIANNLDFLQANNIKLGFISLTDIYQPTLSVSANQFINDAAVLSKIISGYNLYIYDLTTANLANVLSNVHVSMVSLVDTANNVTNNLDYLQAKTSKISTITLNDNGTPTLSVSVSQFINDAAVLGKISGNYFLSVYGVNIANLASVFSNGHVSMVSLVDTANNVTNNIDYLQAKTSKISTITLNDNGTPTLSVSASQYINDANVLGKISGNYFLSVYGVNTANLASVLSNTHVSKVILSDMASLVASSLDYLQANANKIFSISLNDFGTPSLSVSFDQFNLDATALAKIYSIYKLSVSGVIVANLANVLSNTHVSTVTLVDMADNIASNIDYLQTNTSKIATITLNDNGTPTLFVSANQFINDTAVLGKISGSYFLSVYGGTTANLASMLSNTHVSMVSLSDSANNVANNIDYLQSNISKISTITLNDNGTPTLFVSFDQLTHDASVLGKITGSYNLFINAVNNGVNITNLASVLSNPHVIFVKVYDTASLIANSLDYLQTNVDKVAGITLTDGSTPTLAIRAGQLASDAAVLSKIGGSYNYKLSVSSVIVANLANVLSNTHVSTVTLADTASLIANSLDYLQTNVDKIADITLTDAGTPTLAISAGQLANDAGVLSKIGGNYNLSVNAVTTEKLADVLANPHVLAVSIADNAGNVATGLDSLQTNVDKIADITLTDRGTPTLAISAGQLANDAGVLSKIGGNYNLSVNGVTTANLADVLTNPHVVAVSVADNAGNVATGLDSLQTNVDKIADITLTDGGTPTLFVSFNQLTDDATALSKINGNYNLSVPSINTANFVKALANPHVYVSILDSASNVSTNLDSLQANADKITDIFLFDSGIPTLTVSADQLASDASVLGKITGNYKLLVNDVNTANLANVLSNPHVFVSILDSADHVVNNLDILSIETDAGKITSINLTDSDTPTLSISVNQFNIPHSFSALLKIVSPYNLSISGVTIDNMANFLALALPNSHLLPVALTDNAYNISHHLDSLQSQAEKISVINLTDSEVPTLTITAFQLSNDASILSKINGNYNLSVSGVTTANLAGVLANSHVLPVALADLAYNVANNIDYLQSNTSKISTITLNENGTPTLSVSFDQLTHDASVLGKITGSYNLFINAVNNGVNITNLASVLSNPHVISVKVYDTASLIANSLDYLQTNVDKVAGITLTDAGTPTLAISAGQLANDAGVLSKIGGSYKVSVSNVTTINLVTVLTLPYVIAVSVADNAGNVSAGLNNLQACASKISSVTLTDGGTPTLAISAGQLVSDSSALGLITGTYHLSVSGVTTANLASVLANSHVLPVALADSATNVTASLDSLQANAGMISSVTLTDGGTPTLAISAGQLVSDSLALGLIAGSYNLAVSGVTTANLASVLANSHVLPVALVDSAGNVSASLGSLQANVGKISAITLSDAGTPTLAISAGQLVSDSLALGLITGTYHLSVSGVTTANLASVLANSHVLPVALADSANNIAASLDSLQANVGMISSMTLTDGGTPTLAISAGQLVSDSLALGLIAGSYNLSVSGVTTANLTSVLANSHVLPVALADSASNIAVSLDSLQASAGMISSVTLTDGVTPTLAISAGQLASNATVLGKMGGNYNLSVSGVTTANLASVLANSHVVAVSIVDSAGNVTSNLDSLQANVGKITGISLSDVSKPTISISALQATNDAAILAKISSAYTLSVASSGVTVANLTTAWANNHNQPVMVSDSASNVAKSLDSLQTNTAKFSRIALTDTGTPAIALTASQFVKDVSVLNKISTAYHLNISGETVAKLATDIKNIHVTAIGVVDSAANVLTNLDKVLLPNVAMLSGISLTGTGTQTLAVTASQFALDSAVLGKITSAYNLKISGELVGNVASDVLNSHVTSITVADSSANVLTNLDTVLLPNLAKIGGITLTDASTPTLAMTASQFKSDSALLAKISSAYNLSVSGELAGNVATDVKNTHVKAVGVVDTATHVTSSLAVLQSNVSKLSGISLTDSSTPTLTLSASQVKADLGVLNTINSPYVLSVKDSVANINALALEGLHTGQVEILPTSLLTTLKVNTPVSDLNLSLINLSGLSITEKVYQGTGTEVDLVASNGVVKNTLLFTHDTVDQLHLLGIGNTVVHVV